MSKLQQAGVDVTQPDATTLRVRGGGKLRSVDVTTEEYPGFATDLQAQYMALMTQAEGIAIVIETIFENRFMHAQELARMGANIRLEGRQAIVAGPRELTGAGVIASDLRASASLVLAALVARGETVIDRVYHIDRGYEKIEAKLARAGAQDPARGVNTMAHNPGFLKLVNDAKSRVKEIDIEGYKKMRRQRRPARPGGHARRERVDGRPRRQAPCTSAKASSSAISRPRLPTRPPNWCSIAAADSARRWWPTTFRRWATRKPSRSMAAGAR